MTGQQIKSRAEYIIDEEIEVSDAINGINLGLHDLALEAPRVDTESLILAPLSRSVIVPSDCLSIDQVWLDSCELGELDSPFSVNNTIQGTPAGYYLVGNELKLFPLTDTERTVNLLVQKDYGSIITLEEQITTVPQQFFMALVYWLLSQFKYYDDEIEEASYYTQEYYRYRTALKDYQYSRTNYSSGMTRG